MGITRIANVTGLDNIGIPVVMVCRPNSRSLAVSQGKGLSLDEAKASGLMEAIELYHGEHITLPLKLASYEELRYTHDIVDVDSLPKTVRSRFHYNLRLLWIEGYDLIQQKPSWVPYELVHSDFTLPLPSGCGCFPPSSNGLASGNHILEAVSHGICEIVERDSSALWALFSKERRQTIRVSTDSVNDPACKKILSMYREANVKLAIWETTTDIGIPSFRCLIMEESTNRLTSYTFFNKYRINRN